MGILKGSVERRLSAALGTRVSIDKLNFSILGGSAEAFGIVIAGNDPSAPLLTVRKVKAEVSLAAALKKEFVVKSLAIERPVLTVTRAADGRLNLPKRTGERPTMSDKPSDTNQSVSDDDNAWKFEAKRIFLVDGETRYHDAGGYRVAIEGLVAEVKEADGGMEITLLSDSAGRRDRVVDVGPIRIRGRADGVTDLSKLLRASVSASFEIGEMLRGRVDVPAFQPLDAKMELSGTIPDLNSAVQLLPDSLKGLDVVRTGALSGRVELSACATYHSDKGLCVPELSLRGVDLNLVPRATQT